jgi:hypothetical protein
MDFNNFHDIVKDYLGKVENFEYVEVDPTSVVSSFTFSK